MKKVEIELPAGPKCFEMKRPGYVDYCPFYDLSALWCGYLRQSVTHGPDKHPDCPALKGVER